MITVLPQCSWGDEYSHRSLIYEWLIVIRRFWLVGNKNAVPAGGTASDAVLLSSAATG